MESRTFHGLPQVPLCHIVTSLVLFIIRNVHKSTRTPTYLWDIPEGTPSSGEPLEHKSEGWRGVDEWLDGSGGTEVILKCWTDVPSTLHNALERVLCHLYSIYGPFQKVYRFLQSVFNTELQCHWTVSQSSVSFEFNIKCGTRWQTQWGKAKRADSPWSLEREGRRRRLVF